MTTDVHATSPAYQLLSGPDNLCIGCHVFNTTTHNLAKGDVLDTTEPTDRGTMKTCEDCHTTVHSDSADKIGDHLDKVACEVCHITAPRDGGTYESRNWTVFVGGKPVTVLVGEGWTPVYKWYAGESEYGNLPILSVAGERNMTGAKIYPFAEITTTYFVVNESAPIDSVIPVPKVKAADANKDNTTTVDEMRAYDGNLDGVPDYPDAYLRTEVGSFQISHQVAPAAQAYTCANCHNTSEGVLDFSALGYAADPSLVVDDNTTGDDDDDTGTPPPARTDTTTYLLAVVAVVGAAIVMSVAVLLLRKKRAA